MHKLLFIITLLGFLLLPAYSFSQEITPESDRTYEVEEFVLPGGRLGNNVNSIVQGPQGFIWFGSHGGVHRYDGYEITTYKNVSWDTIGESTTLTFPYAESLLWDSNDKLWVGTFGNGLYQFDPNTEKFKHYPFNASDPNSISDPRVLCAAEDQSGQLWFGTERGLNRYDPETGAFVKYFSEKGSPKSLVDNDIRKLYIDKQGTLWLGTGFTGWGISGGALSKYNPETNDFTSYIPDQLSGHDYTTSAVRGMLEDSNGRFWFGTAAGLFRFDRKTGDMTLQEGPQDGLFAPGQNERTNPITYSILEDSKGGTWVGTIADPDFHTHLLRYDESTRKHEVYPVMTSVWDMMESGDGTIWVAGAGLSGTALKITPKSVSYDLQGGDFYDEEFLRSRLRSDLGIINEWDLRGPNEIVVNPDTKDLWTTHFCLVPKANKGFPLIARHNPSTLVTKFYHLKGLAGTNNNALVSDQTVWVPSGMAFDDQGSIWGSYPSDPIGIFAFDPTTETMQQWMHNPADSTTISSNIITRIVRDRYGHIWASTVDAGVNKINTLTGEVTRFDFSIPESFDDNSFVIALMEANDGKIWAGGEIHENGEPFIAIINPLDDTYERMHIPLGNSFFSVNFLAQSPITDDVVFINEGNTLGYYDADNEEFTFRSNAANTFPLPSMAGVVCDPAGNFWVSNRTSSEFIKFDDALTLRKISNASARVSFPRQGTVGPDGIVYFINSAGWARIDPDIQILEEVQDTNPIKLVELYINGEKQFPISSKYLTRPASILKRITLDNQAETIGFRFSDFNYQTKDNKFLYRLYPYEQIWKTTNMLPIANYYRVPDGAYELQVKQPGIYGNEDSNMLNMTVTILPPWWRSWWAYIIYGVLLTLAGFALYRYQKARVIRAERERHRQKELEHAREIEKAYTKLEVAHKDLKATQSQLIQSEKMASLGELTAGIAHEIQNPLNFVNNFSEINSELLEELREEIQQKNYDEVEAIAESLEENEQKILSHGQRAGTIVKSMLQHSRSSKGQLEEVDLNQLVDEYLRLAFHGTVAKDKTFTVDMQTNFDKDLGKLKLVPQDIGKVILNLMNNAFYAVHEKKQKSNGAFKPTVSVRTKKENGRIAIEVADNGTGITEEVANKIFQPFFTTKPAGEGAGLGLSLSYDIIKAHGGDLSVESKLGEGTKFVIRLPV